MEDRIPGEPDEDVAIATQAILVRYTESPDGQTADPVSEFVLIGGPMGSGIAICHTSHAGGSLNFAPDGTLLLTTGEGAHWDRVDDGSDVERCVFIRDIHRYPPSL